MEMQNLNEKIEDDCLQKDLVNDQNPPPLNKEPIYLPERSKMLHVVTQMLLFILLYASLYGILGKDALPGSEIFSLLLLAVSAYIAGKIVSIVKLPPLIGMLIVGFLFRNLTFIPFHNDLSVRWATTLRSAAFIVILLKAGLGLDARKLKELSRIVFQLAFCPCIVETIAITIASYYLLGLPWMWGIMLGFVISAVSPAVTVPGLLSLQEKQFGVKKGIPTLVIAAASVDDIIAITGFTVILSSTFSLDSLLVTFLKGLLEPVGGIVLGVFLGRLLWLIPSTDTSSSKLACYRITMLCLGGFTAMFLSKRLHFPGVGPIACLVLAFVAAMGWKKDKEHFESIETTISFLWNLLQPFLFSLIGCEVSVENLQSNMGSMVLTLFIAIIFRIITATFVTFGGNFNIKEKIFIAFAWLPKATVQAAIGPQALDYVLNNDKGREMEDYSQKILTAAVLSIIMTAPIGAALIAILGPLLLHDDNEVRRKSQETGL